MPCSIQIQPSDHKLLTSSPMIGWLPGRRQAKRRQLLISIEDGWSNRINKLEWSNNHSRDQTSGCVEVWLKTRPMWFVAPWPKKRSKQVPMCNSLRRLLLQERSSQAQSTCRVIWPCLSFWKWSLTRSTLSKVLRSASSMTSFSNWPSPSRRNWSSLLRVKSHQRRYCLNTLYSVLRFLRLKAMTLKRWLSITASMATKWTFPTV